MGRICNFQDFLGLELTEKKKHKKSHKKRILHNTIKGYNNFGLGSYGYGHQDGNYLSGLGGGMMDFGFGGGDSGFGGGDSGGGDGGGGGE